MDRLGFVFLENAAAAAEAAKCPVGFRSNLLGRYPASALYLLIVVPAATGRGPTLFGGFRLMYGFNISGGGTS